VSVSEPQERIWQMRVFPFFTAAGWILILIAFFVGLLVLSPAALAFFGDNAKAVRDAAQPGSPLLGQLRLLEAVPRWLEPLAFLGVASFIVGIALIFSAIPTMLRQRGELLGDCFPRIVRAGMEGRNM